MEDVINNIVQLKELVKNQQVRYPPAIVNIYPNKSFALINCHWIPILQDITLEQINAVVQRRKTNGIQIYNAPSGRVDKVYIVTHKNDSWQCTCPGYYYRKHCRHIDGIKDEHYYKISTDEE